MQKTILFTLTLLLCACSSMQKTAPEEQFKKSFPENKFESFDETAVKGVYEVYDGHRVYYYLPDGDVIILGNMISKDKRNLTRESEGKKMAAGLKNLPLDKAIKIGSGKTQVVEFIDPNCYYCRLSFNFFQQRKNDVTMYVFFYPLSENSAKKIRHIICSKDRASAYEDVMSGKLDGDAEFNLCEDKEADEIEQAHQQASARARVRATPLFYIKEQVVPGFDQRTLEQLLAK